MALTGKAQIAAYDADGSVRVLKQLFCFFHLTPHDKCVHGKSQFFLKISRKIAPAEPDVLLHVFHRDMLAYIQLDKADGILDHPVCRDRHLRLIDARVATVVLTMIVFLI